MNNKIKFGLALLAGVGILAGAALFTQSSGDAIAQNNPYYNAAQARSGTGTLPAEIATTVTTTNDLIAIDCSAGKDVCLQFTGTSVSTNTNTVAVVLGRNNDGNLTNLEQFATWTMLITNSPTAKYTTACTNLSSTSGQMGGCRYLHVYSITVTTATGASHLTNYSFSWNIK